MKQLIVANWKMNPQKGSDAQKLFKSIDKVSAKLKNTETVICPPLVYLQSLGELVTKRSCVLGAQDAFWEHEGAFTGQVSPDMIFYAKARYVIVGHSERRGLGETDEMVNKKIKSILQFPLIPILCVGEEKRDDDLHYIKQVKQQVHEALHGLDHEQISRVVIAYEPVWAIGTKAKTSCSPAECREMMQIIRQTLADILKDTVQAKNIPLIYGGSVDEMNASSFIVDGLAQGLLIGRASLEAKTFSAILKKVENIKL